jgi:hypothetical protein
MHTRERRSARRCQRAGVPQVFFSAYCKECILSEDYLNGGEIELETPSGKYQYRVIRTAVVGPKQVELVQRSSESDLTLVTYFPFYYVGPAPQRFVVQALPLTSQ